MIHYVAEIAIDKVEKGVELEPGGLVYARYWSQAWKGAGYPPPGASDAHSPNPNKGDPVRVYLVNKGYNGGGQTKDGGYDVYFTNGFEILTKPSE